MTKLWYCTMQESADEVDYMSDAFLKELEDVRPGLLNREAKRKTKVCNLALANAFITPFH